MATVVAVGGPELALRLAGWPRSSHDDEMMLTSSIALWELRPGCRPVMGTHACISAEGLRTPAVGPKTRPRVLFVGDSSVFGVLLPDDATIEARLAEKLPGVEVLDGGVPGYSSEQALRMLRAKWMATRPDLLVIGTLWSDSNFDAFVDSEELARMPGPFALWLGTRTATGAALTAWTAGTTARNVGWGLVGQDTVRGLRRVPLARYAENLEAMVTLAHAAGAQVMFLELANEEDLFRPDRPWAWDPYRAAMEAAAARHGALLVNVPALWRESGKGRQLLGDAMHPSPNGARTIAEGMAAALQGRGWPRSPAEVPAAPGAPGAPALDPWVDAWQAGASGPSVAGVVTGPSPREPVVVGAVDVATGAVLDSVSLPGCAPFSLRLPEGAKVQLTVTYAGRPVALRGADLDLSAGPKWAVRVDLGAGTVQ